MLERRIGGETGVKAVTYLSGDPVWEAGKAGRFSMSLLYAACDALEVSGPGGDRSSFQTETRKATGSIQELCTVPHVFLIEYSDGVRSVSTDEPIQSSQRFNDLLTELLSPRARAAMFMLNVYVREPSAAGYACQLRSGEVEACEIHLQGQHPDHRPTDDKSQAENFWRYFGNFAYVAKNFEEMVLTGEAQYPVERVMLTSGILEAALLGRKRAVGEMWTELEPIPLHEQDNGKKNVVGERMATPWMESVTYSSYTKLPHRPTGPRPAGALISAYEDRAGPTSARL